MFKQDLCNRCGDCLSGCRWVDIDSKTAVEWMEKMIQGHHSPILDKCITCYACNELCPENAYPFDLIAALQEKYHTLFSQDKIAAREERFVYTGDLPSAKADRIISLCVFKESDPELIKGELYDLPQVSGNPYFCWVLFSHLGGVSVQKKHAEELIRRLAMGKPKEVVCFHDDCYTMLTHLAPEYGIEVPFRPVHLSEHIVQHLTKNKHHIRPINIKMAYQRPCASRYTPEKEHFIDELFDLVGIERIDRAHDRKSAMCCAGVKNILKKGDPAKDQEKNINDAIQGGAQAMVYLCPMCRRFLSSAAHAHDLPLVFLGDLARIALGEINLDEIIKDHKK